MKLAHFIHDRWAAAAELAGLLPPARVFTGLSTDPARPYAVILKQSDKPIAAFNDGSGVDLVVVRIEVHHDSYDAAAAILQAIKAAFDRTAFDLTGDDRVTSMRRANDFEAQEDNGSWRMTIDFNCTVFLASGV